MNRLIPAALAIALLIAGGTYWMTQSGQSPAVDIDIVSQNATADTTASSSDSGVTEMVLGSADAPVTIIEYASFTCPHCATFHADQFKQIKANYVETGKVRFIFREVFFDRFGLWASMVARCGGSEKFFGMSDLLMKGQKDWSRAGDPVAIAGELRKVGRLAGLGEDQLQACLKDEDKAKALVAWYQANATADEIDSTPSFVINGQKYSNMSYGEFVDVIEEKIGG